MLLISYKTLCHFLVIISNDSYQKSFNLKLYVDSHLKLFGSYHELEQCTRWALDDVLSLKPNGTIENEKVNGACVFDAIDQRIPSLVSLLSIIIQQSILLCCTLSLFDWQSKDRRQCTYYIWLTPSIIMYISI